jgi:hypothetical protein
MKTKMHGIVLAALILVLTLQVISFGLQSEDAYIATEDAKWILGTASVERIIALENGKFHLISFKHKSAGLEMVKPDEVSEEFSFSTGDGSERINGASGGWKLVDSKEKTLKNGELQLDIVLQRGELQVTKSYVVYPKNSIIREWVNFKNTGSAPIQIVEPSFLDFSARLAEPDLLDFYWMVGSECKPGSWVLKKEALTTDKIRQFDSYDPFPEDKFPGDGVFAKVIHNNKEVWKRHVPMSQQVTR